MEIGSAVKELSEFEKEMSTWSDDWKLKESWLSQENWTKIADTMDTCNTPVYQKEDKILLLDCNFGDCSHFYIKGEKVQKFTLENLKNINGV